MFLVSQIQECVDQNSLFDLTCRLLRHVTGFDRVIIYKFDADWNGEVHAEACKPTMEPFIGLRFPHWDIPEQARAIMARIQLRLICDVDHQPVQIAAQDSTLPPLDISLAQCRAVSPLHMQYLRNMGTSASMTLSVVIDDVLWGMISFHHETPRRLPSETRQILTTGVLPIFCLKLGLLRDRAALSLSRQLDRLQTDIQAELEKGTNIAQLLSVVGPTVCSTLDVDGLVIATGSQNHALGYVPSQGAIEHLIKKARCAEHGTVVLESMKSEPSEFRDAWGDICGVLATSKSEDRCLLLFRRELIQNISWAGNPEKTIETVRGNKRLQPRGSFARYLEAAQQRCKPWSDADQYLSGQLWPLLSAAERQAFMTDLSRQQTLMINELNHRVRNILALVKSVSQRARKDKGSLESYSQALESRIMALAAAHDIGAGSAQSAVPIRQILALETEPFNMNNRFTVTGGNYNIRADLAPLFALVIHELTTNAVKYGALSNNEGVIDVHIAPTNDGISIDWVERGGPAVVEPTALGFGTTLIRQAVPYELNGSSSVEFTPSGFQATLHLPVATLDKSSIVDAPIAVAEGSQPVVVLDSAKDGVVLILEDNFMIATDMVAELEEIGFTALEVCASAEIALEFLESATPSMALLDINLGQGRTSEDVATELVGRGVPFAFVTGYGDTLSMPPHLSNIPALTKPVSQTVLRECVTRLIGSIE